jgi:hypothetical protein
VAAGFGVAINGVQRTNWGHLFNISALIASVWVKLFKADPTVNNGGVFFRMPADEQLPLWACWMSLGVFSAICLYMLHRKIRGAEVVR